jgi:hypothetical protein
MDDLVQHGLNRQVPDEPSRATRGKAQSQYDADALKLLRDQRALQGEAILTAQKIHYLEQLKNQGEAAVTRSFTGMVDRLLSLGIDPTLLSQQLQSLHNNFHRNVEGSIEKYAYRVNR